MKLTRIILALSMAVSSTIGVRTATAGKSDDTLTVGWGVDGAMPTADNYYGNTRTGFWFSKLVWDTLVDLDPETGEYVPSLATNWHWINGTTLEMNLKEGVRFHNGEPFDADDVVYTLNHVSSDKAVTMGFVKWIERVEKVSQFTTRIHTKMPFPQALAYLAGPIPIYPNEYYEKNGTEGMNKAPVGTGPYKITEIKTAERYVLTKNDDHAWNKVKGVPKISKLVIREIPDAQTQAAELMSGGIDFSADLTPDLISRLQGVTGIKTEMSETLRVYYISLDAAGRSGDKSLKDQRVRQALNYAIDKKSIVNNLMGGAARIIATPCHPAQFGCATDAAVAYPYDPEKSRRLLADAGYSEGLSLDLYAATPAYEAEAILGYLSAVGIQAKLNRLPYEAVKAAVRANRVPAFLTNWGSYSLPDISAILSTQFNGGDDDPAKDADVAKAISVGDMETDVAKRKTAYAGAIKIITEKAYWVPLFSGVRGYAWNADVSFKPYPDEIPRFYRAKWN